MKRVSAQNLAAKVDEGGRVSPSQVKHGPTRRLAVAGGWGRKEKRLNSVDIFDFDAMLWRQANYELPGPPRSDFAVATLNDRLYFLGGEDDKGNPLSRVDIFDLSRAEWTTTEMPTARRGSCAVTYRGRLLVIGGSDAGSFLSSVVSFDPQATAWKTLSPMNTARSYFGVGFADDEFYAVGGSDGLDILSSVERYDPKHDVWSPATPMRTQRAGPAVVVVGDRLFAIGGRDDEKGVFLRSGEVLDVASSSSSVWVPIAEMPIPRANSSAAVHDGRVYVIGGQKNYFKTDVLDSMDIYDPAKNSWTTSAATMLTARSGAASALFLQKSTTQLRPTF